MPVLLVGRTQFKMCCLHGHDSLTWQGIECRFIRSHLNMLLVRNMQHQSNGFGPVRGSEASGDQCRLCLHACCGPHNWQRDKLETTWCCFSRMKRQPCGTQLTCRRLDVRTCLSNWTLQILQASMQDCTPVAVQLKDLMPAIH
jgi:hypothetical protein